jgi:hypothetical protein
VAPVDEPEQPPNETVTEPAKVMRIGSMVKQLLEEWARRRPSTEAIRRRLGEIYTSAHRERPRPCRPTCKTKLHNTCPAVQGRNPSDGELRVGQGAAVGWLEGCSTAFPATFGRPDRSLPAQQLEQIAQLPP